MKARIALLITLLLLGGLGAEWWYDDASAAPASGVTKMDGPVDPPPSPNP